MVAFDGEHRQLQRRGVAALARLRVRRADTSPTNRGDRNVDIPWETMSWRHRGCHADSTTSGRGDARSRGAVDG